MMRRVAQAMGQMAWWGMWPVLWLVCNNSERTRVLLQDKQGNVLLVRGWLRADDSWGLPGGGMHRGESATQGALREVQEELGLTLSASDLRSLGRRDVHSRGLHLRLHFFVATLASPVVLRRQRHEIAETTWVSLAKLTSQYADIEVLTGLQLLAEHS